MAFIKAKKSGIWLRMALCSPSGGGKTMTSLYLATALAKKYGYKIAFIDSERGSAKKYADLFDFDVLELKTYEVENYIKAIKEAQNNDYKICVIDSLTHAWAGVGGILDAHGDATKKSRSKNSYTAWREVTPLHNKFIDAMLSFNGHLITTMRTKTEYVVEKDSNNKTHINKMGMAPIQRDGMEYEFDIVGDMDLEHNFITSKTRCRSLDGKVFYKPGEEDDGRLANTIIGWLGDDEADKPEQKEYATEEQVEELENLRVQLRIVPEKWETSLGKYNASKSGDLTKSDANEILSKLRALVEKDDIDRLIMAIEPLEKEHYPVAKAVTSAHKKYIPNKTKEEYLKYYEHLQNRGVK